MIPNAQRPAAIDEVKLERYRSLLGQTAIFRGCTSAALEDLARRLQVRSRPASTVIVAQGNPVLMPNVAETLTPIRPGYDACFIVSNQARIGRGEIAEAEVMRRSAPS